MFWMVGSILIGQARYIYRREIMKEIIFTDPSKGYAIEVTYKDGTSEIIETPQAKVCTRFS